MFTFPLIQRDNRLWPRRPPTLPPAGQHGRLPLPHPLRYHHILQRPQTSQAPGPRSRFSPKSRRVPEARIFGPLPGRRGKTMLRHVGSTHALKGAHLWFRCVRKIRRLPAQPRWICRSKLELLFSEDITFFSQNPNPPVFYKIC